jgi:hypothetical protein
MIDHDCKIESIGESMTKCTLTLKRCCDLVESLELFIPRLATLKSVTSFFDDVQIDTLSTLPVNAANGALKLSVLAPFQEGTLLFPSTRTTSVRVVLVLEHKSELFISFATTIMGKKYFVDDDQRKLLFTEGHGFAMKTRQTLVTIDQVLNLKREIGPCIAIRFPTCGIRHVTIELEDGIAIYDGPPGPLGIGEACISLSDSAWPPHSIIDFSRFLGSRLIFDSDNEVEVTVEQLRFARYADSTMSYHVQDVL